MTKEIYEWCLVAEDTSWRLKEAKFGSLSLLETDVHHSEERYLELLDSFNGVTETYHLTSLTVSPGVT